MVFKIKPCYEHFVVYIDGKFFCSADSRREAKSEIEEYARERGVMYEIQSA